MWVDLPNQLANLDGSERALVLRGAGGTFCAGANIAEFLDLVKDPEAIRENQAVLERAQLALECAPCPVVAQIQGSCFGGGLGLALACDFRIAEADCRFAITPARLGIVYSLADTHRLHRTVGAVMCREMLLNARVLDAGEALAAGLVNRVVEPGQAAEAVEAWVAELRRHSGFSQRAIKRNINFIEGVGDDTPESLHELLLAGFAGDELTEGAEAFLAKREPDFER